MLCKKASPKRWFGNMNMWSSCDVTNTSNNNDHHKPLNETHENFCVRHSLDSSLKRIRKMSTLPPLEKFLRTPML